MVYSYAPESIIIQLTVNDDMAGETCESLNLMVDQVTVANMWQPGTKVTDLSFSASYD